MGLEAFDFNGMALVGEPGQHAVGYHFAHVGHGQQFFAGCGRYCFDAAEVDGYLACGGFAHETDSQGEEHAVEGHVARSVQAGAETAGALFFPALKGEELGKGEVVQVGRSAGETQVEELLHRGFAGQDVHGLAAGEMQQFALYLHGAAVGIGAEPLGLVFLAHEGSAAVGADGGELRPRGASLALRGFHCRYFGDYLAALLHIHPVAFVDVQGGHLVGIDQRGTLDYGAAELYRLQVCHRSNGPGAAHLIVDGQDGGEGLLGLELVCYRPTGHLGRKAQGALKRHFVDFDDYSVGGEGEELALGVPVVDVFLDFAYAVHDLAFVRHRQPPAFGGGKGFVVAAEFQAALGRDVVEGAHEAAAGHFLAVEQLQRTRRGVAGVGERRLAGIVALAVKGVEGGVGHQHLATDLEVGREIALERVGDIGDASGVFGDVVALYAVAAGEGTVELAVAVGEADGGAVELELAAV